VEDSPYNQKLALGVLGKRGHRVTVAADGTEAVALARQRDYDVILMDVQMPEMDGLEATRCIRRTERETGGHVPIIAMTAQAMKGDRERCLEAGMDDYLMKPIRGRQLHAAIDAQFSDRPSADEPSAPPPSVPPSFSLPHSEVVDWAGALGHAEDDPELLRELVEAFLEECPQRLGEMQRAVADADTKALRRAAHTINGALRTFGATEARGRAAALESLARNGDLTQAPDLLEALQRALRGPIEELTAFLQHTPSAVER
ncbi:MAG: response regulator, partial [Planctomycetaceae bacterium]